MDENLSAFLNIFRTILVCFVLSIGSLTISLNIETMIVDPIEKMLTKIELMS
jgi:hypothetical protein